MFRGHKFLELELFLCPQKSRNSFRVSADPLRKAERSSQPHAKQTGSKNPNLKLNTMATETFVLPGEILDPASLPSHPKLPLKLGPGLRHIPPNTITSTVAGQLCTDKRKNAVWVEFNGSRVCHLPQYYAITNNLVHPHCWRPCHSHDPKICRRPLLRQS
jgi:hypothetical protein